MIVVNVCNKNIEIWRTMKLWITIALSRTSKNRKKTREKKKKNTKNDVFFARKIAEQQITEGVYSLYAKLSLEISKVENLRSLSVNSSANSFRCPLLLTALLTVHFFLFFFTCEVSIERLKREGKKKKKKKERDEQKGAGGSLHGKTD